MNRFFKTWVTALSIFFVLGSLALAGTYTEDFSQYLVDNQSKDMVGAILTVADRVDMGALQADLYARKADRREWHEAVVRALQEKATESQAPILAAIDGLAAQGLVGKYQGLWLGNVILVTATPQALDQLVARDDVLEICPDYGIESVEPLKQPEDQNLIASVEIGLERIHAPEVWAMGITGEGRLISHLDTGVDGNHPALSARWRGLDPRYADHPDWAWFDPVTNTQFPFDSGQHGTHTMGTMCGLGEATGDTIGVAFGAEWISAGVIDRVSIPQTVQDALLAFQWLADPDGNPSTVWDVPDVCSNSWGVTTGHGYPPCDETFWSVLDDLEAASVVVVFAAGNEGPGASSLRRPADRATTDFSSFSVGAVDGNNDNLPIADFSSRGPSYCTPDGQPTFKPEVCAPGVNVRSSVPGGSYQGGWSGTSMATPHVSGVVALMRQANPNLTVEQVKQILMDTATDLGPEGEDNSYGMGFINAYEAVQRALAYLEGWGTLAGQITDQASGLPIQGARVSVLDRPWAATSRANGWYYLFMPADTVYDLRVEFPPTHLPIFDQQSVAENETTIVNYALEGKVTVTLKASFGNPTQIGYRSFYIKGSWDNDGFYDAGWSGDLLEVKDDGVAPDNAAGDGIYTGRVLLARDTENTYSWAVYSENYGGDDAMLQEGADFDIPDLNPPNVPTLAVNPSGSDNNFVFSVEGDNGLSLDLAPGVDSRPFKWGASDSLTGGVTYTFRFHVMHSDVASYGSGGIGGPDLQYTPEVDGAYDFIFNDNNDSYIVQLAGTEGPPTYLSARSGEDGHIPLAWLMPGMSESQEIAYDDGALENAYYYYASTNLMAEMFIPESYPVTIDSVMIHVLTEGDPYWPWPDGNNDPVGISIYLDNGSGMPDPDPVFYTTAACEPGQWIRVDVDEILVSSGNFWVAMNNLSDSGPYDGIGLDAATDYPANKWAYESGVWSMQDLYTGDHMIRAKVFGGEGASSWMAYDDATPANDIPANVKKSGNAKLATGTAQANKMAPATERPAPAPRLAYHPHILSHRPPTITDTEVLAGYNLYRDTQAAPFDRHLKINTALITETHFDDWGADQYGPIVNGTLYHYQASAVYDIGGGNYVEVGPSNEATATPQNHPPMAPVNLTGDVTDHTVTLSWDQNTDYDIASYNVYRRDYNQSDFHLVGNVVHPTTTFSEDITIDGIYRYKLKAVDTGGMESDNYSNYVDMAVGLIPPGVLSASDDREFKVALRWRNPGGLVNEVEDLDIAVVISDYAGAEQEVVQYLIDSGEINSATVFDAQNGTPTLADLEPYDMVLTWSNYMYQNPSGIGDVLADYVDLGKGVVALEFAFTQGWGMTGRFISDYSPFGTTGTGYISVNLGDYDDSHPIMEGVSSLGDYFVFQVPEQNNAEVVAYWDNGWPAVAVNGDNPQVACINAYIGYPDRQWTGDMMQLVLNTIMFVSGGQGVTPDGFKLYKADNESGPFSELASLPGSQTDYDDMPLPNGVPYYYRVTAIWDGDESAPSNTAMGIAMNYPPEAPTELETSVMGYDVNLTWEFTDLMGDLDHYNISRKMMPYGEWEDVGTSETNSYTDVLQEGDDGAYGYVVTAVDNGDPQMESVPSNTAYALVGHLPPVNLIAIDNYDEEVPLRWMLPGSWRSLSDHSSDIPQAPIITKNWHRLNDGSDIDLSHKNTSEPHYPPVILDQGGPDEFGYTWIDSDEPGGPSYEWRDITGIGEMIPISYDDDNIGPMDIGFDFPFYGETYSTFNMCSNGWISFTSTDVNYWNQPIPDPAQPLNLVAPFWDDLYPPSGGEFYYYTDGAECIISWIDIPHINGDGPYTFQIILRSTGTIIFQYENMQGATNSCTIGIQNADGSIGLQVVSDADYLHSEMAIRLGTGPDGAPPVHYNLYRNTASPVPVDMDHLVTADIPGDQTSYMDEGLTNGTTYYYVMTSTWNDSVASPASNEASATPVMGGRLSANYSQMDTLCTPGISITMPMTLTNTGGLPVDYDISCTTNDVNYRVHEPDTREFTRIIGNYDKSTQPNDPSYPPVITDFGGPDEFGYVWIDSDEPNGPTYNWIDLYAIGDPLYMGDDENQGPFYLDFNFPFYGELFSSFNICSNGFISFTSTSNSLSNSGLPDPYAPENLIAGFWDDLNPYAGGSVYYYFTSDTAIVAWLDVPHYAGSGTYSFEIILTSSGAITLQYQYMTDVLNSSTIGIQNGDMTIGLQVAYDQYYIHDEMAIRINSGWLSTSPNTGTIQPGGNAVVNVVMDATYLELGIYTGNLAIHGEDMNHPLDMINIPVTLEVVTGIEDQTSILPREFTLDQNYPNPFNARTEIRYALPVDSDVKLEVYNVLGQKVTTLVNEKQKAGYHLFVWDGTNSSGATVSSGMYMYKLITSDKVFVKKMLMLK